MSTARSPENARTEAADEGTPMIRKLRSLSARLIGVGLLSALLMAALGGWALRHQLHDVVLRSVGQELSERAEPLAAGLRVAHSSAALVSSEANPPEFLRIFSGWYWTLQGPSIEWRSRSLWDSAVREQTASASALRPDWWRARGPMGEPLIGLQQKVHFRGDDLVLTVFGPATEADLEMERIDRVLLTVLGGFVALFTTLMLLQVRVGLTPLRRLQSALWRVRQGRQAGLGKGYGPDLDPLVREITEVLDRNALLVERSRNHASNLGHALKKSLALLNLASRHPTVPASQVLDQVAAINRLIDRHLSLAASGAGDTRWVEVAPRLEDVLVLMRHLHAARQLDWTLTTAPDLRWRGEATDLEEMVGNLMDNAGKWAHSRVQMDAQPAEIGWRLQVDDDGPGLSPEQRQQAMRRGIRFDESVAGNGLGLAIAQDIAETYGGSLTLEPSPLGGLRCILTLR
jgi:signal transduction histidine kinase